MMSICWAHSPVSSRHVSSWWLFFTTCLAIYRPIIGLWLRRDDYLKPTYLSPKSSQAYENLEPNFGKSSSWRSQVGKQWEVSMDLFDWGQLYSNPPIPMYRLWYSSGNVKSTHQGRIILSMYVNEDTSLCFNPTSCMSLCKVVMSWILYASSTSKSLDLSLCFHRKYNNHPYYAVGASTVKWTKKCYGICGNHSLANSFRKDCGQYQQRLWWEKVRKHTIHGLAKTLVANHKVFNVQYNLK